MKRPWVLGSNLSLGDEWSNRGNSCRIFYSDILVSLLKPIVTSVYKLNNIGTKIKY